MPSCPSLRNQPFALKFLQCGKFRLDLGRPLIMGVVNVTPDSFSDGGRFESVAAAAAEARRLIDEGADIIDIGGESTRPGAQAVDLDIERQRVLPVLERLADVAVPISVDTRKPELMREAIAAGASMINDIEALQAPAAIAAVAGNDVAVCLMHKRGTPADMQHDPNYDDVVADVAAFLSARVDAACAAGIARERIVVDPGFGFGKTLAHNLELLRHLRSVAPHGVALLAGISRKSMLGRIAGREPHERVYASVAAALIAAQNGAHIVRVHDVAATRDALAVLAAVTGSN
jgi:dihydropteroate synthase